MIYKNFKGKKLSALGFGTMRLPIIDGDNAKIDDEKVFEIFDRVFYRKVNNTGDCLLSVYFLV